MSTLQAWLSKPRATIRVDTSLQRAGTRWPANPFTGWIKALQLSFGSKRPANRPRIEVLDRLSLGGKKALLLVAIGGRQILVGVGDDAPPSVSVLGGDRSRASASAQRSIAAARSLRRRMRRWES